MNYKQFTRTRLLNALWYCGFYGTAFLYSLGTIIRNNTSLVDYRKNLILDGGPIPIHILMGLGLVGTFFFQSLVWTGIKDGFDRNCLTYLTLTFLPVMTFYSRRTELFLSLLALISLVQFGFNILRCLSCTIGKKGSGYLNGVFFAILGLFILVHVIVIPLFIILPLIYNQRYGLNIPAIFLSICLVFWWLAEAFTNPLYKYIEHWIKHIDLKNVRVCPRNVLECCLFPIRDDISFNLAVEKLEIKQRETKSIQRRKPKDRGVFVQTLKCMVAIRRKLNKRRASESSSDDSDSEEKDPTTGDDPGNEADSSEEESSSEEEDNEADKMKREYQEETARALMEDIEDKLNAKEATSVAQTESSEEETREPNGSAELEDKKND